MVCDESEFRIRVDQRLPWPWAVRRPYYSPTSVPSSALSIRIWLLFSSGCTAVRIVLSALRHPAMDNLQHDLNAFEHEECKCVEYAIRSLFLKYTFSYNGPSVDSLSLSNHVLITLITPTRRLHEGRGWNNSWDDDANVGLEVSVSTYFAIFRIGYFHTVL